MSHRILMVEDDYALGIGTEYALQSEGYEVVRALNLKEARAAGTDYDLILLDVMLPDGNGYELCKEIRNKGSSVPIIFLTAVAEEANVVQGLEIGADDYVAKPYRLKELLSRIAANIRRNEIRAGVHRKTISFGRHVFYPDEFKLLCDEHEVDCSVSELKLLRELLRSRGNVLSRRTLMEKLYDVDGEFFDDNTLSVYVKRLRDKLGCDGEFIDTVRGVGYRFKG